VATLSADKFFTPLDDVGALRLPTHFSYPRSAHKTVIEHRYSRGHLAVFELRVSKKTIDQKLNSQIH
jgi:hypothetical protein